VVERPTICALLFRRVGDSLIATPALRAIKKHHAECQLVVFCETHVTRVFEGNPWIDRVIDVDRSPSPFTLARAMRRAGHLTTAVDFLADPRTALACRLSGANHRVGFAGRGRSWLYTQTVARQDPARPLYSAEHKLGLSRALEAPDDSLTIDFILKDREVSRVAGAFAEMGIAPSDVVAAVFPYSRRDYKRWPTEHFVSLCRALHTERAMVPVLLAGPGEVEYCTRIAAAAAPSVAHVLRAESLGEIAAALRSSILLIGNDGGPKHLAVAVGTPTVTIFGNDPPEYWTPPNDSRHVALTASGSRSGMSSITTDTVLKAVDDLLPLITG